MKAVCRRDRSRDFGGAESSPRRGSGAWRVGSPALRILALCIGLARAASAEPSVEGRVTENGKGVAGAEVYLLSTGFHLSPNAEPVGRAVTGPRGAFALSAPPGDYVVVARTADRFAYFGRNPVRLESRLTDLNLPLVPTHPVERLAAPAGAEALNGRVLTAGQPVAGARVFVYVAVSRGLRGPGYAVSEPTGDDGSYEILLPPGTYFAAARRRPDGSKTGTLEPGDLFGVLDPFPLVLKPEEVLRADIETVALPSRELMARFHGTFGRLSGTVVDQKGGPVAGLRACAYETPKMLDRPVAVSEPTREDGLFVIENLVPRAYFLGARETLGGPPAPGERVGFLRGSEGARVELRAGGSVEGLTVIVQVVP